MSILSPYVLPYITAYSISTIIISSTFITMSIACHCQHAISMLIVIRAFITLLLHTL